jgi:hypothetical protein
MGFMKDPTAHGSVLRNVLGQLRQSSIYLAILTKDIKVQHRGQPRWSPSVWVTEEKGMALGLEKPFVLVVHRDIHEDFWRKTAPHRVHIVFDDSDFDARLPDILEAVTDRYQEVLLRSLSL